MKITDVTVTEPVYIPARQMGDAINEIPDVMTVQFARVTTDEGLTGLAPMGGGVTATIIETALKNQLVGEDPLNTERIWEKMYWATMQWGRRGAAIIAISVLDMAVWDLKGKILGQPIHKILGGHRDTVPSYGSGVNINYTVDELVKEMASYAENGFKMVKMKIGKRDPKEDLERIRLVRDAIGPDVDLAVDVNNGWSLTTAIRMAAKLEEYHIYWLEEPILADEIDSLAKLGKESNIPIAVGENHYTRWEFKELMDKGAVEIVQADIGKCGGVTEFIKIAAIADTYGLPVCPHHTEFVDAPLVAAVPNGLFHEYIHEWFTPMEQLFVHHIEPKNGEVSPLDLPGFGIEIDQEAYDKLTEKPAEGNTQMVTKKGWRWPPYL